MPAALTTPIAADPPRHVVDVIADLLGTQRAIADALGVGYMAVNQWKTRGVPLRYCQKIVHLTGGAVTLQELRPDDWFEYWPEQAATRMSADPEAA